MLRELFGAMYEDVFHGGYDYVFLLSGFGGSRGGAGNNNRKPHNNNSGYQGDPLYDKAVLGGSPVSEIQKVDGRILKVYISK